MSAGVHLCLCLCLFGSLPACQSACLPVSVCPSVRPSVSLHFTSLHRGRVHASGLAGSVCLVGTQPSLYFSLRPGLIPALAKAQSLAPHQEHSSCRNNSLSFTGPSRGEPPRGGTPLVGCLFGFCVSVSVLAYEYVGRSVCVCVCVCVCDLYVCMYATQKIVHDTDIRTSIHASRRTPERRQARTVISAYICIHSDIHASIDQCMHTTPQHCKAVQSRPEQNTYIHTYIHVTLSVQ